MVNASLMAPLDMARFALAYIVLAIVPGYALATLLRPRAPRSERLALAIPCAYALVALGGLATALLHLPFDLPAYAALALPITLARGYTTWRRRGERRGGELGHWWLVPAGVALVEMVVIALLFAGYVVPVGFDVITHVVWTNLIAGSHVFPIALLSSNIGAADGGFYPPVFHVLAALVQSVVPMATYKAVFYSMAVTVVMLPLALFSYVRAATDSPRLGALAALASLAFDALPFFVPTDGLYTFTVAQLFVPALAVTLRDGLGHGDRRAAALAALLGIGLFYTHPTEFVTAALLALAIVPGALRTASAWARAAGYALVVGGVWLLGTLPALAAVHRTMVSGAQPEIHTTHDFAHLSQVHLSALLGGYVQQIFGINVSYVLLVMAVIGAAWCLVHRRWFGLVAVQAIAFALFVDATSYNLLRGFYVLSFPWALAERLAATHYWFALPLAAIGVDATVRRIGRIVRAKSHLFTALAASPLLLHGLLLPLDVSVGRVAAFTQTHTVMAAPDLGAVAWLARHAPAGSVVANDSNLTPRSIYQAPTDAGLWMPFMGGPQPLFWRGETGPGTLAGRNYLLRHVADSPLPPRAARFISRYHVRYVFYGARIRDTATRHLNLPRLLTDPLLHLVYASAATCRPDRRGDPMNCPATASYVFAFNGAPSHG